MRGCFLMLFKFSLNRFLCNVIDAIFTNVDAMNTSVALSTKAG